MVYLQRLAWCFLLLAAISLQGADQTPWNGTWAANIAGGAAFAGTWSAAQGEAPDTVGGSWALLDQNGTELATGTWAAGKEGRVWKGTWQARRVSGQIYDGTWRAQTELRPGAHFGDLFEAAITSAVSGNWRMGSFGGAWTIRTYGQK
jgi:hypothetical protein